MIHEYIIKFSDENIIIDRPQELVRCKDCMHGEKPPTFQYYPELTWCNKYLSAQNGNWFCADGKRKEEAVKRK